ncbi:MAG: PLP-dependent aminotransferase family protein [Candidatus Bipolaricaulis sp.]|nr:PLP-dependent aminotransferase family protein [Candidatus Bipolaricaulis sp.]
MVIAVGPREGQPLHTQIADSLRARIEKGELVGGERLPTTRDLAKDLGVSRSTVVRAYEQLAREGRVEGRVGMGTVVSVGVAAPQKERINWNLLLTPRVQEPDSEYAQIHRMLSQTDLLSFAGGLPSPEFFPGDAFQQLSDEVLRQQGAKLLQWCPIEGYPPLRSWIAERLGSPMENVMVLSGSTQGIHLLTQAFLEPGDTVLVEAPTYAGAIQAFRGAGARIVSIPSGPNGIDLEQLEAALDRVRAKFLYIVPTYHNPTGGCLPIAEREALVTLAAQRGLPIVEDDPYSTLRYDGPHYPSLYSLDPSECVIYLSTFSKSVFPGLRIGWIAAPTKLLPRLVSLRNLIDLFTNSLAQGSLYEFCKRGMFDAHLQRVRSEYVERRDAMVAALRRYVPTASFDVPHGGLFVWVKLPQETDARRLLEEAIDLRLGFITGPLFYPETEGRDRIRLSFACHPPKRIVDGMRRLGLALQRSLPSERASSPERDDKSPSAPRFVV